MHVIKREPFEAAKLLYPNCADALDPTFKALKRSEAKTPADLRQLFPSLDNFKYVDKWYVIDIGGNKLRLIVFLEFGGGKCFVKHIVTHKEYERITAQYRNRSRN